jgi:hypothetical protein
LEDAPPERLFELLDGADEKPQRIFVCYRDEHLALKTTLTVSALWTGSPVVVRVDQREAFGDAFRAARLMEDLAGTLHVFAVIEAAGEPALIDEDLIERLARAIHERYLLEAARRGDLPGLNASLTSWETLPEYKKEQNRRQAADIGLKLKATGCVLAPSADAPGAFPFSEAEVERLARMEHARWMRHHTDRGWTYGPERNEERKEHPDILDWSALPEEGRDMDRATVRALPDVLADAGFRIVRLTGPRDHPGEP